jgi:hypothetical protein
MFTMRNAWKAAVVAFCSLAWGMETPQGWFLAGNRPADYDSGVDAQTVYGGQPSAYLKSKVPAINGFGTLMQSFKAEEYLGKRIRFSAFVKTDAVQDWAGLWLRVDGPKGSLAFDNMQTRAIKGTTAWQNYEVVLDVPAQATGIAFGILMSGAGSTWISGVKMEAVGTNVPTTEARTPQPSAPVNLALEAAVAGGAPRGWILAGDKPASYDTGVETDAGRASVYLKSKDAAIEGFGTLMQMFDAHKYVGKRVRFSGSVKADGVQKSAGLWMRVDKEKDSVAFDNMQDRPIKGTSGWQSYTVVLDVPRDATAIGLGILLGGTGAVWLNRVSFEVVGTDVATTGKQTPKTPTNLGFEK